MKYSCDQSVLLDSWRQCAKMGLSPDIPEEKPYLLSTKELRSLCQKHQTEIAAFQQSVSHSQMPKGSAAILTDTQGILLEKKHIKQWLEILSAGVLFFGKSCWNERSVSRHYVT